MGKKAFFKKIGICPRFCFTLVLWWQDEVDEPGLLLSGRQVGLVGDV